MISKKFQKSFDNLDNNLKNQWTSFAANMADFFTAPDVDKKTFIRVTKADSWDKYPRPFKLGIKLIRAYLIAVYDLCLEKDVKLPDRFSPPAQKLLERKNYFAQCAGKYIKWAAENRAVMAERDKNRCTCHKQCPVHRK